MKYNQPYGVVDLNAPYLNGNPAGGIQGSIPPAWSIEHPQREIVYAITASGQTPSELDLTQLWQAMQRAGKGLPYGVAGGTANAITVTPNPAPASYGTGGYALLLKITAPNTTAVTVNVNGLGAKSVVLPSGAPLRLGHLIIGEIVLLVYDGTILQLFRFPSPSRETCILANYGSFAVPTGSLTETALSTQHDPGGWKNGNAGMVLPETGLYDIRVHAHQVGGVSAVVRSLVELNGSGTGVIVAADATEAGGQPWTVVGNSRRLLTAGDTIRHTWFASAGTTNCGSLTFEASLVR